VIKFISYIKGQLRVICFCFFSLMSLLNHILRKILKGLVARCHSFYLFLHLSSRHTIFIYTTRRVPLLLYSLLLWDAEPRFELGPAVQQAGALLSKPRPCTRKIYASEIQLQICQNSPWLTADVFLLVGAVMLPRPPSPPPRPGDRDSSLPKK
jgi:hypothetical protein